MIDIKRCKNDLCGKLLYLYQDCWDSGYCCIDCHHEDKSYKSLEIKAQENYNPNEELLKEVIREYNSVYGGRWGMIHKNSYPHIYLPINLVI